MAGSLGYADRLKNKRRLGGQLGAQEYVEDVATVKDKVQQLADMVSSAFSGPQGWWKGRHRCRRSMGAPCRRRRRWQAALMTPLLSTQITQAKDPKVFLFTGAGISTSTGIPDFRRELHTSAGASPSSSATAPSKHFTSTSTRNSSGAARRWWSSRRRRGPNGIWTLKKKKLPITAPLTPFEHAKPSFTHMVRDARGLPRPRNACRGPGTRPAANTRCIAPLTLPLSSRVLIDWSWRARRSSAAWWRPAWPTWCAARTWTACTSARACPARGWPSCTETALPSAAPPASECACPAEPARRPTAGGGAAPCAVRAASCARTLRTQLITAGRGGQRACRSMPRPAFAVIAAAFLAWQGGARAGLPGGDHQLPAHGARVRRPRVRRRHGGQRAGLGLGTPRRRARRVGRGGGRGGERERDLLHLVNSALVRSTHACIHAAAAGPSDPCEAGQQHGEQTCARPHGTTFFCKVARAEGLAGAPA